MSIIQRLEEACNLPQDILSNTPIIRMYGGAEVFISNYKGLLEFSDNGILLQCYHCRLHITGRCLWIRSYDQTEIDIRGNIEAVQIL